MIARLSDRRSLCSTRHPSDRLSRRTSDVSAATKNRRRVFLAPVSDGPVFLPKWYFLQYIAVAVVRLLCSFWRSLRQTVPECYLLFAFFSFFSKCFRFFRRLYRRTFFHRARRASVVRFLWWNFLWGNFYGGTSIEGPALTAFFTRNSSDSLSCKLSGNSSDCSLLLFPSLSLSLLLFLTESNLQKLLQSTFRLFAHMNFDLHRPLDMLWTLGSDTDSFLVLLISPISLPILRSLCDHWKPRPFSFHDSYTESTIRTQSGRLSGTSSRWRCKLGRQVGRNAIGFDAIKMLCRRMSG